MLNFFYSNESLINFLSLAGFLVMVSIDLKKPKTFFTGFIEIVGTILFSALVLNTILNGVQKGF